MYKQNRSGRGLRGLIMIVLTILATGLGLIGLGVSQARSDVSSNWLSVKGPVFDRSTCPSTGKVKVGFTLTVAANYPDPALINGRSVDAGLFVNSKQVKPGASLSASVQLAPGSRTVSFVDAQTRDEQTYRPVLMNFVVPSCTEPTTSSTTPPPFVQVTGRVTGCSVDGGVVTVNYYIDNKNPFVSYVNVYGVDAANIGNTVTVEKPLSVSTGGHSFTAKLPGLHDWDFGVFGTDENGSVESYPVIVDRISVAACTSTSTSSTSEPTTPTTEPSTSTTSEPTSTSPTSTTEPTSTTSEPTTTAPTSTSSSTEPSSTSSSSSSTSEPTSTSTTSSTSEPTTPTTEPTTSTTSEPTTTSSSSTSEPTSSSSTSSQEVAVLEATLGASTECQNGVRLLPVTLTNKSQVLGFVTGFVGDEQLETLPLKAYKSYNTFIQVPNSAVTVRIVNAENGVVLAVAQLPAGSCAVIPSSSTSTPTSSTSSSTKPDSTSTSSSTSTQSTRPSGTASSSSTATSRPTWGTTTAGPSSTGPKVVTDGGSSDGGGSAMVAAGVSLIALAVLSGFSALGFGRREKGRHQR